MHIVSTEEQLHDLSKLLMTNVDTVYLDLESTGLDPYTTRLLLVSLRFHSETYVIDFLILDPSLLKHYLGFVLTSASVRKVLHNAVFDTKYLMHQGFTMQNVFCTQIAEQVLKSGIVFNAFGLDDVALRRLRIPMDKAVRNSFIDRDLSTPITYTEYAYSATDVDVLEGIYAQQVREIERDGLQKIIYEIEMPLIPITASMEYAGVNLDADKMREAIPVVKAIQEKADAALQEMALYSGFATQVVFSNDGYTVINTASQAQMKPLLNHMGVDVPSLGRKELTEWDAAWQRANPEDVLDQHEDDEGDLDLGYAHPVLKKLAVAKATDKLLGTYLIGLLEKINPVTGRLHPGFRQCGAVSTGRFSSNNPNFQNIPNTQKLSLLGIKEYDIRSMFVAAPQHTFVISDYSGIELSILAALSGDENLIAQICAGDVHSYVGNTLFGDQIERVLGTRITKDNRKTGDWKTVRDEFKRVSYAIGYGSTGWNIYRTCGNTLAQVGLHITREDADQWVDRWQHELFPRTGVLLRENARLAVTRFYTTSIYGRRRHWIEEDIRLDQKRFFAAQREGMNQPIQSSSADMTKKAMLYLDPQLDKRRARIVACIHDELLVEARDDYVQEASALTKKWMEFAGREMFPGFPDALVIAEPKLSKKYDK
jgi:DNA polymerase-1